MTKKNLPNIPIYIGDWERDCNVLSLESEAAWMRIIFKMWIGGKQSIYKLPTKGLQNLWRCNAEKVKEIVEELTDYNICEVTINGRFTEFKSRRFEKENVISKKRSKAVSNRYNKTIDNKPSTKHIQITENENESDIENEDEIKSEITIWPDFEDFWELYDKKIGSKTKLKKKWDRLSQPLQEQIMQYIPIYIKGQPEKKYRKNPETFLNNESWNDEIITNERQENNNNESGPSNEYRRKQAEKLGIIQP